MNAPGLTDFLSVLPSAGTFSLYAGPVDGPAVVESAARVPHYAASTMKVALVVAAYRLSDAGALDLDQPVEVHDEFESAVPGKTFQMDRADDSDPEPWGRLGESVALRWLCYRSIVRSSNLATNLVLERVCLDAVADALKACGATDSRIVRGIEDCFARDAGRDNLVTARDLAMTLRALSAGEAASKESCDEILQILAAQQINDGIPAGLPAETRVAHKSGWVTGISHDAAVVYPPDTDPYLFVMCTTSDLEPAAALDVLARGAAASWADRKVLA
jgi:beta-lactamase class A